MRFGTNDGKQLVIQWPMREVPMGDVLKVTGYMKMRGRNAHLASRFMTAVWYCVYQGMGYEAQRRVQWKPN